MKRAFALTLALLVLSALRPAAAEEEPVVVQIGQVGDHAVTSLAAKAQASMGELFVVEEQLEREKIDFVGASELTYPMLVEVLETHEILILVERVGDRRMHRMILQRNTPRYAVTPRLVEEPSDLPDDNELVSIAYPVRHASPNALFAAIRGLINRDPKRLGNVTYVRDAQKLILSDLAPSVRYYWSVLEALDQPPARASIRVSHLSVAAERLDQLPNEVAADEAKKLRNELLAGADDVQVIHDSQAEAVSRPEDVTERGGGLVFGGITIDLDGPAEAFRVAVAWSQGSTELIHSGGCRLVVRQRMGTTAELVFVELTTLDER